MATISSLYVKVLGDSTGLQRSLATASASLKAFGSTANTAGATATRASTVFKAGFVLAGVAAADAIGKGIAATQDWAGEVRSLQRVTGQTAEEASSLAGAAASLGIGVDKLTIGFGLLSKNIVNGAPNLAKYGIAVRDTTGQLLPFDDVLDKVSDKFLTLPEGPERAAFAMNVFGRSGKTLIPILARGAEGLDELRKGAEAAGLVMSQDTVDAARDLSIAQRELSESVKGASISLGQAFIPVAQKAVDFLTFLVQAFVAIPAPLKTAALSFAVVTGAIAAFNLVVGFTSKAWTTFLGTIGVGGTAQEKLAADAGLAAGAMGVEAGATEGLTLAIQGLTAALGVELPAATGRAELALAGYGATESGLIVPTEALTASQTALGASMAGTATKLGFVAKAWLGLKGLIGTFGVAGGAALGVLAFTPELPQVEDLTKIEGALLGIKAASADTTGFSATGQGAKADIAALTQIALAADADRRAFGLAAREGITYSAALDEMAKRAGQLAGAQSGAQLVTQSFLGQIRDLFSTVTDGGTKFADLAGAMDLFAGATAAIAPSLDHLTQVSGQDFNAIRSDLLAALSDPATTVGELPAIFQATLSKVTATVKAWRDQVAANFGGASAALSQFVGQGTVAFGDLTRSLTTQRQELRRWQADFDTILADGGAQARTFLQDMSANGLDSIGILDAVAAQPKKIRDEFLRNYNDVNRTTDSLAGHLVAAFGKAADKITAGFTRVFNAFLKAQGLPPIVLRVDTTAANAAINSLAFRLAVLTGGGGGGTGQHRHSGGAIMHAGGAVRMHSGGQRLASDEVPAILQRGEFVIRRSAVQQIGVPALQALNKLHSGGEANGLRQLNTMPSVVKVDVRVAQPQAPTVKLALPDRKRFTGALDDEVLADGHW